MTMNPGTDLILLILALNGGQMSRGALKNEFLRMVAAHGSIDAATDAARREYRPPADTPTYVPA